METVLSIVEFARSGVCFVFVKHFSDALSVLALGVSAMTLYWHVQSKVPKISASFALLNADMKPRWHFITGVFEITNTGRCAFSVNRAGLLLVNGWFAPDSEFADYPIPVRPGESVRIKISVNVNWLVGKPLVPAVFYGSGRKLLLKPFFAGPEAFVN